MECYTGRIWTDDPFEGYICVEDGRIVDMGSGDAPPGCRTVGSGDILPSLTDAHTHVADAGLHITRKYSLEELVAPPNGLKHRYLNSTSRDVLVADMRAYCSELERNGIDRFMDFREGGLEGVRMLREASDSAFILGRPVSEEFDPNEVEAILKEADGIGISSISDMPVHYIEAVADMVHRAGKALAVHVSERVREDIDTVMSLSPDFIVHMCTATDADMRRCAEEDVPVVICARSNMYFDRVPPLKRFEDAGVSTMAGTDNAMIASPSLLDEAEELFRLAGAQGCRGDFVPRTLVRASKLLNEEKQLGWNIGDAVRTVSGPGGRLTVCARRR